MANEMFFNDMVFCYNYSAILFWNGVDFFKYIFIDPYLAVESVGLIIHKSPIVYF